MSKEDVKEMFEQLSFLPIWLMALTWPPSRSKGILPQNLSFSGSTIG
jgi:hypothetical protein